MRVRLVSDESGVALGLAVIMVVLVGVMGAGLLTLVAANLQAVVAINRGQQAFEMSEAGVEVAKARLAESPGPAGFALEDLDGDPATGDSAAVEVEELPGTDTGTGTFRVVSVGRYADARRAIEATFDTADGEPRQLTWRECYSASCDL